MGPTRIAKNTAVVLFGQIANMALTMVVIIYFARSLGEAGFGIFSFLIAFTGVFAVLADFGIGPILLREMSRTDFDPRILVGNTFLLRGTLTILSFLAINILSLAMKYSGEMLLLVNIMMANILFSSKIANQRGIFESIFRVNLRMEIPVLLNLLDGAVLLTLTILLVRGSPSLLLVTLVYTISNLPGFILLVIMSVKYLRPKFDFQYRYVSYLVRESLPLAFYLAVGTMYDKFDVLFLKIFTDDVSVGVYSAAMRLTAPLNFLPFALVTSFFPLLSKYHRDSAEKVPALYTFGMKTLLLIGLTIAIYVTFTGKEIIETIYAGKFLDAVVPLTILIWAQVLVFLNFFQVDFNTALNRQKTNSVFALFLFVANIILNLLLIPRYGVVGASIAKLGSVVSGSAYLYLRSPGVEWTRSVSVLSRLLAFALTFCLFLWILDGLGFFYVTILGGLAFVVLSYLLRIYDRTEINRLRLVVSES